MGDDIEAEGIEDSRNTFVPQMKLMLL